MRGGSVDNVPDSKVLQEGAERLGITVPSELADRLLVFRDELLKWNKKVNLTAITDPREVLEKHFLDSLAVLPEVEGAASLLDLGAGAGFPGIPLKLARPALSVTLVDAVGKKVAFMKQAIARLGLAQGGRAVHVRAEGDPQGEGLPPADRVICRAFMDVPDWLPLARHYLAPGGQAVAMLGRVPEPASLDEAAHANGLRLVSLRKYALPFSGAERGVAVFSV